MDVYLKFYVFLIECLPGHGQQKPDPNGYEEDGMNECILPMDFNYSGDITDDLMNSIMIRNLPSGVKLMAVMDCCHSGTGLDLPFQWNPWRLAWREETNPYHTRGDVQLISGCIDAGVACDSNLYYTSPGGALTLAFCSYLRQNPCPTYPQLLDGLTIHIRQAGFRQRPVLSSSQGTIEVHQYFSNTFHFICTCEYVISTPTHTKKNTAFDIHRPFLLTDIIPNINHEDVVGRRIVRIKFKARPRRSYLRDRRLASQTSTAAGVGAGIAAGTLFGCILGEAFF